AEGLLHFLERLENQELVPTNRQVEYVRTHPLTQDRVDTVRNHVAHSPNTGSPFPPGYDDMLARVKAKLFGFLSPQIAMRRYQAGDTGIPARYARAIAEYKGGDISKALAAMDGLIAEEPENPFFHELKGQMLLETGRLSEARPFYERAVELYPREPLLLVALAQTKLGTEDPEAAASAVANLESAVSIDSDMPLAWHLLATAYGRAGNLGMAAVALAEEALVRGDETTAAQQADRALQILPAGSSGALQAQDIRRAAEDLED
ncbi:MAG TPA: tetratricopeptide repeat protein, partial [Alphaproteobacteria bacterium]|nr:tetratricopeptide repeat protein [Alphaproteobacteria bacterium]